MPNLYDIAYSLGLGVSAPVWMLLPRARRKVFQAFEQRMGEGLAERVGRNQAVLIHAVSLGEVNAARGLVERLRQVRPDVQVIVSTTTETGFARASELYAAPPKPPKPTPDDDAPADPTRPAAPPVRVVRYPLDFSSAINRVLDALRPSVVVLMELEVWPNFIRECHARGIAVLLVNGRLTSTSYRRYRWARPVVRRMMQRLSAVCAQDQLYARRFQDLGAAPERTFVTGTMKFDTATVADRVDGDEELAAALRLNPASLAAFTARPGPAEPLAPEAVERVWVCGSTGPGEEEMALAAYRSLLRTYARLRLVIVPRHPERFDAVAELIRRHGFDVTRRSTAQSPSRREQLVAFFAGQGLATSTSPSSASPAPAGVATAAAEDEARGDRELRDSRDARDSLETVIPPVVLGDTMGELRKFYSLADVVFVGRSLVDLGPRQHGSDMIEPAALGKPVIVGPFTTNFADAVARFVAADAIVQVGTSAGELERAVAGLLASPDRAGELGRRAQQVVLQEKGATDRNLQVILHALRPRR